MQNPAKRVADRVACAVCSKPLVKASLPVGQATCYKCRQSQPGKHTDLTCADCGTPMWRGRTSNPQGQARCLGCRRASVVVRVLKPRHPPGLCGGCGTPIGLDPDDRRWKYCSDECRRKVRRQQGSGFGAPKRSSEERGYGHAHRKLRRKLLPEAYGTPCPLCGYLMDEGDKLHLDHTEDRTGYRGMVHASCNIRDGARRGAKAVNHAS